MKSVVRISIVVATGLLVLMDFNISAVSRIDHLVEFSQSIRNFTSTPDYSSASKFPYNVPSYVAVHMTKELNAISDMAHYKEVSLNPTNLDNLANKRESEILAESDTKTYRAYIEDSRVYLTRYDPIMVKESCVRCHGLVETAPQAQIERYGSQSGYGFRVGDNYGLKVVSIDITWFLFRYVVLAILCGVPIVVLAGRYNQKIHEAMNIDTLSGALNKNCYLKTKHTLSHGYFIVFDIDDFKVVNDSYGHHYGDIVIAEVCRILRAHSRESDKLFRFGGEEFVLFMGGAISKERVQQFLDMALNEIRRTQFGDDRLTFRITISAGACNKQLGQSIDDVMFNADKMLYRVKKTGKDDYLFYDDKPYSAAC